MYKEIKDIETAKELARLECKKQGQRELGMAAVAVAWGVSAFLFLKAFIYFMGW